VPCPARAGRPPPPDERDFPAVSSESTILVGEIDDNLWVRICGRGSFHTSPALKELAAMVARRGLRRLVIDLQDCPVMDSTFMGTVTGIALGFRDAGPGAGVLLLNANPRNIDLLENLGLDQIIPIDKDGSALPAQRRTASGETFATSDAATLPKTAQAAHVLEAHETLAAANPANRARFLDVVSYLREELGRSPGAS
jgi:anti-anti-sigma regulatory factor